MIITKAPEPTAPAPGSGDLNYMLLSQWSGVLTESEEPEPHDCTCTCGDCQSDGECSGYQCECECGGCEANGSCSGHECDCSECEKACEGCDTEHCEGCEGEPEREEPQCPCGCGPQPQGERSAQLCTDGCVIADRGPEHRDDTCSHGHVMWLRHFRMA